MSKNYYVYCAYGVNNEILYIGKGSGTRYQHCNNGASANKDLITILLMVRMVQSLLKYFTILTMINQHYSVRKI